MSMKIVNKSQSEVLVQTIFLLASCWIISLPSTTNGEILKCWSNMRSSSPISGSVLDLDSKLAAAASKEEEEEGGDEERKGKRRNEFEFDLSEDLYEEECSFKSEICAEIDITLKLKNKESTYDVRGCMQRQAHEHLCKAILDKLGDLGDDKEYGEIDCKQSASYCVDSLCNNSLRAKTKKTIAMAVGAPMGIAVVSALVLLIFKMVMMTCCNPAPPAPVNNISLITTQKTDDDVKQTNNKNKNRDDKKLNDGNDDKNRNRRNKSAQLIKSTMRTQIPRIQITDDGDESLEQVLINDMER